MSSSTIRILGVDPGTIKMGYGVIEDNGDGTPILVAYGVLKATGADVSKRLGMLYEALDVVMLKHKPHHVAAEGGFISPKNIKTGMMIAQARAIPMILAGLYSKPFAEYPPSEVKRSATPHGNASKAMVQQHIGMTFELEEIAEDAADALAVAICHGNTVRYRAMIAGARD